MSIAASARVSPKAQLGVDVEIGEFAVVEDEVVIGDRCRLESHVVIKRWTTLGEDNEVSTGTVLGTDPLDKKVLEILQNRYRTNTKREYVQEIVFVILFFLNLIKILI